MHKLTCIYWILNEARYLPEYLEFHLLQGVDHFIFWQDADTDNTPQVLAPYIDLGLVEYRTIPPEVTQRKNFWIMAECIAEQRGKSEWIHFHAIDERLFCPDGRSLPQALVDYERPEIAGIATNWTQLHSGGAQQRLPGLLMENYTLGQAQDPQHHVKTMVRPHLVNTHPIDTPHNFSPVPGTHIVNEKFEAVVGPFNHGQYTMDVFWNFHYATMSQEEYEQKMNKGVLDGVNTTGYRRANADGWWQTYHGHGDVYYNQLLPWVDPVRQAIAQRFAGQEHLLEYVNH